MVNFCMRNLSTDSFTNVHVDAYCFIVPVCVSAACCLYAVGERERASSSNGCVCVFQCFVALSLWSRSTRKTTIYSIAFEIRLKFSALESINQQNIGLVADAVVGAHCFVRGYESVWIANHGAIENERQIRRLAHNLVLPTNKLNYMMLGIFGENSRSHPKADSLLIWQTFVFALAIYSGNRPRQGRRRRHTQQKNFVNCGLHLFSCVDASTKFVLIRGDGNLNFVVHLFELECEFLCENRK